MENNLSTTLQQLDANGATLARRAVTFTDIAPSVGEFLNGLLTTVAETTITLPIAQTRQLWFRNTHASAKITVKWTPNGGAEVTVGVIGPGALIAFWNQVTGASYGVSSLKLTSDTLNATYELFIGG